MGEIAEVQLLQLLLEVYADIDTQFQVWLSITFAVMVAAFIAGERFSRTGRLLIVALYGCASTILLLRYLGAIELSQYVFDVYAAYDVDLPEGVDARVAALRFVLMPVGTLVAGLAVLVPGIGFRRQVVEPDVPAEA
jgi:hypothetical protein